MLILVCTASALAGEPAEAAAPKKDEVAKKDAAPERPANWEEIVKQVDDLIAQLGTDDWGKREAATKTLIQLYPRAVLYIEKSVEQVADPEIRERLDYVAAQPHEGLVVYRFRHGLPGGLTAGKLKELSAVGAPQARVAYDAGLKLLLVACDEPRDLRRVQTLFKALGVDTEAYRVTESAAASPVPRAPPAPEAKAPPKAPQEPNKDF